MARGEGGRFKNSAAQSDAEPKPGDWYRRSVSGENPVVQAETDWSTGPGVNGESVQSLINVPSASWQFGMIRRTK